MTRYKTYLATRAVVPCPGSIKPVPPENSQIFDEALTAAKVLTEYLNLPSGGHGLNGYKGPMWDAWQERP